MIACDSDNLWRKRIYPDYKAQRIALKSTDPHLEAVSEGIKELKQFFNDFTNIPAVSVETAEADDVIAVTVKAQQYVKNKIISSDKDFIQLLDKNTTLYAFTLKDKKERDRTSDDPAYDLFEKCIRGDRGDNIFSAYPRVQSKRLKKAWEDPLEMMNLMGETLPDGRIVKEAYEENKALIDLRLIPDDVEDAIIDELAEIGGDKYNNYHYMKLLRYFGDTGMIKLADSIDKYDHVFKTTYRFE